MDVGGTGEGIGMRAALCLFRVFNLYFVLTLDRVRTEACAVRDILVAEVSLSMGEDASDVR